MTNESLIQELVSGGYLKTPRIIEAFRKIDRKDFIPPEFQDDAYGNYPLPIGFGQTISQPLTVAFMLELLEPKPGEKILDVGSGSGWQTCLLAYIASRPQINADRDADARGCEICKDMRIHQRKSALVFAIERIPELKKITEQNVSKYNFVSKGIVKTVLGDGSKGAPPALKPLEGFDKIIAVASTSEIPENWKRQLKIGGRIVAPVGQSILKLDKISEKEFKTDEYFGFSFVPLIRG